MPVEAPPCSAPCPGAAGGTRAWAGELILPERFGCGAEVVAELLLPEQSPCAEVQPGSALTWSSLGAALSCSGHRGDPSPVRPRRAQHISIPGSRVRPHGGCSPGEGIEGGLAV